LSARNILIILAAASLAAALVLFLRVSTPDGPVRSSDSIEDFNILLITIDTLRADHVRCLGGRRENTPALDTLAKNGVLFSMCISAASVTGPSVASIMTGATPRRNGVRNNMVVVPEEYVTLPELVSAAGYETAGFTATPVLSSRVGFAHGFDHFGEDFEKFENTTPAEYNAEELTDLVISWLDDREGEKPFFAWAHYYDPHWPYTAHYGAAAGTSIEFEYLMELYVKQDVEAIKKDIGRINEFYDQEIFYTDMHIGRLLHALETSGDFDDTLIIVTADHGEELFEHEYYYGHTRSLHDTVLNVPLVIRFPGGCYSGLRVDTVVWTPDVFSTILDLLGKPAPDDTQSVSLMPIIMGEVSLSRPVFSMRQPANHYRRGKAAAVTSDNMKLISFERGEDLLFDHSNDPGERINLAADMPVDHRRLLGLIDTHITNDPLARPAIPRKLDKKQERMLKGLGYIY